MTIEPAAVRFNFGTSARTNHNKATLFTITDIGRRAHGIYSFFPGRKVQRHRFGHTWTVERAEEGA